MPWHLAHPAAGEAERDAILVGTTETPFTGDPERVRPLPAEIDYLEQTLHHYFPGHRGRVLDAFAGLRVLPAGEGPAFRRRRETVLAVDDPADPLLVTVYGGKLTGYRAAAARVLDRLRPALPARRPVADTATLELPVDDPEGPGSL
jgi:glycerol-3-phosphate dehydrogenase